MRVKPADILKNRSLLQRHGLNAVLSNGNTVFGRLTDASEQEIVMKDTRDHEHRIALADLYEVLYDDNKAAVPPSRHPTI